VKTDITLAVDTTDLDTAIANIAHLDETLGRYADLMVARAKQLAPVATGQLRDSIGAEIADHSITLTAGNGLPDTRASFMEYGFHHAGTGQFIQHPFLRPAFEAYRAALIEAVAALGAQTP
jgi:hypothetical protein